jgi:hypothetical protein
LCLTTEQRPDIRAPRWNVTVHKPEHVSEGHWFVAPYETYNADFDPYGYVGPHIYDSSGELVWSGTSQFDGADIFDFRLQDINGSTTMTLLDQNMELAVTMDDQFEIKDSVKMSTRHAPLNIHEYQYVDNGTRVLVINSAFTPASREMSKQVGFDGECSVGT